MKKTTPLLLCLLLGLQFSIQAQEINELIKNYIKEYKDLAIMKQNEYGIPASITLAQALHESNVGRSELAVKGNNHFGIKCGGSWTGPSIHKDDDKVDDCFRKYGKVEDSYDDHSAFLTKNPRYSALFELDVRDYNSWAKGLKKAGYATNPVYAEKIIETIEKYDLAYYTVEAMQSPQENAVVEQVETSQTQTGRDEVDEVNLVFDMPDTNRIHAPKSLSVPRWDSAFVYLGKKAFYAEEGLSLIPASGFYEISLKKLLKYNDLKNDIITESSVIFLEPKNSTGKVPTVKVEKHRSMWWHAQDQAVKLSKLLRLNHLSAHDVPAIDEYLYLDAVNPETPDILSNPNSTHGKEIELSATPKKGPDANNGKTVTRTLDLQNSNHNDEPNVEKEEVLRYERKPVYNPEKYPEEKILDNSSSSSSTQNPDKIDYSEELIHIVTPGQNLDMVAMLYRVSKKSIIDYNYLSSEALTEGQKLLIPPTSTMESKAQEVIQEDPVATTADEAADAVEKAVVDYSDEANTMEKVLGKEIEAEVQKDEVAVVKQEVVVSTISEDEKPVQEKASSEDKTALEPEPTPASSSTGYYTVRTGDNLYRIGLKYNVSPGYIQKLNNKPNQLVYVGEKLKVPGGEISNTSSTSPSKSVTHTVAKGENLYRIALKYGVQIEQIKSWNNLSSDEIEVGQKLKIKK